MGYKVHGVVKSWTRLSDWTTVFMIEIPRGLRERITIDAREGQQEALPRRGLGTFKIGKAMR